MERKNAWKSYDENNKKELEILCKEYREFLSAGKTERECVKQIIAQAESAGYRNLDVYLYGTILEMVSFFAVEFSAIMDFPPSLICAPRTWSNWPPMPLYCLPFTVSELTCP